MIRPTFGRAFWPSALFVGLLAQGQALAGAPASSNAPAVQAVVDCRKVGEAEARLACYDRSVDAMAKAQTAGDLVTLDREQRDVLHRQAFGFNIPTISLLDRGRKDGQSDRLTAKVASASRDDNGRWVIRLEDGAIWVQIDNELVSPDPHPGSVAVVRHAALGSFFMDFDGRPGFRATRRS
jgi:hypothetical protein